MNSRSIVLNCIKSLLLFNHYICTFDFLTFVSCLLTVTLHIVDVRLTCLINITYLLTYLGNMQIVKTVARLTILLQQSYNVAYWC